jgi:hypothetical protein
MAEARPKPSPEDLAGRARIAWLVCAAFMFLVGGGFVVWAWSDYHDYSVRTSPPGGRTTTVVVDEVTTGRHCASSNCAPEYTLTYVVHGVSHQTSIRDHLRPGDEVHAFEGSDGKWYVTEDPGFGNSKAAWVIWAAIATGSIAVGVTCLRSRMKVPKPTT